LSQRVRDEDLYIFEVVIASLISKNMIKRIIILFKDVKMTMKYMVKHEIPPTLILKDRLL
jgi:hypothetical protein